MQQNTTKVVAEFLGVLGSALLFSEWMLWETSSCEYRAKKNTTNAPASSNTPTEMQNSCPQTLLYVLLLISVVALIASAVTGAVYLKNRQQGSHATQATPLLVAAGQGGNNTSTSSTHSIQNDGDHVKTEPHFTLAGGPAM